MRRICRKALPKAAHGENQSTLTASYEPDDYKGPLVVTSFELDREKVLLAVET